MATSIEDMIKSSICFGVAYDGTVKECKICDVRNRCKAKCEMGSTEGTRPDATDLADAVEVTYDEDKAAKATAKKEAAPAKKKPATVAKEKKQVNYADDMPDFKPMNIEDMMTLAEERGINLADFDKYTNDNIKRMRLTMALKKTYEVK